MPPWHGWWVFSWLGRLGGWVTEMNGICCHTEIFTYHLAIRHPSSSYSQSALSRWLSGYQPGHVDPFRSLLHFMIPAWVWAETVWVIVAFYFQAPDCPMTPSLRLSMKRSTITWWEKSRAWLASQVCVSWSCQDEIPLGGPDPSLILCSSQIYWELENS